MQILKISSIKKKFIDDEKNPLKMKLINKIKITENVLKNEINTIKTSLREIKY